MNKNMIKILSILSVVGCIVFAIFLYKLWDLYQQITFLENSNLVKELFYLYIIYVITLSTTLIMTTLMIFLIPKYIEMNNQKICIRNNQ